MRPEGTGHGANLVGVPARLLADAAFNDAPRPLRIAGVRDSHPALLDALESCADAARGADTFESYMAETFKLAGDTPRTDRRPRESGDPVPLSKELDSSKTAPGVFLDRGLPAQSTAHIPVGVPRASMHSRIRGNDETNTTPPQRRFRANYLRLLRGWGFDSNSREGAVLKAWVESRFGIYPTFHKMPLTSVASAAWSNYVEEKMSSRFHNNAIFMQLDLLYEFCQWSFARWHGPGGHLTLYRGVNDFDEHRVIDERANGEIVLRLNNLVSFSANRAVAGEFGDCLLEVQVPKVKVLFHSDLLPRHPLKGEAEYLVIGGDYRVRATYF